MTGEIEYRDGSEDTNIDGWDPESQSVFNVRILPDSTAVNNPGFDITPGRLVTGLITEKGVCKANEEGIDSLFLNENG